MSRYSSRRRPCILDLHLSLKGMLAGSPSLDEQRLAQLLGKNPTWVSAIRRCARVYSRLIGWGMPEPLASELTKNDLVELGRIREPPERVRIATMIAGSCHGKPHVLTSARSYQKREKRYGADRLARCLMCGRPFPVAHRSASRTERCCSQECAAGLRRVKREVRRCPVCGETFEARPRESRRHCSQRCAHHSRTKYFSRSCVECGEVFKPTGNHKNQKHCSDACARRSRKGRSWEPTPAYAAAMVARNTLLRTDEVPAEIVEMELQKLNLMREVRRTQEDIHA